MRGLVVILSILGALGFWVWLTGPGTSLPLALGAGVFAAIVGRTVYWLLTPKGGDTDTSPQPQKDKPHV
jgi:hypothetical protein